MMAKVAFFFNVDPFRLSMIKLAEMYRWAQWLEQVSGIPKDE